MKKGKVFFHRLSKILPRGNRKKKGPSLDEEGRYNARLSLLQEGI